MTALDAAHTDVAVDAERGDRQLDLPFNGVAVGVGAVVAIEGMLFLAWCVLWYFIWGALP